MAASTTGAVPAPGTTPLAPGAWAADEVVVHWTTYAGRLKEGLVLAARLAGDQLAFSFHAGNLLSRVGGTVDDSFTYDQANRLTGSTVSGSPSLTASYAYTGDGLRTSKTVGTSTTQYVWDSTKAVPATPAE